MLLVSPVGIWKALKNASNQAGNLIALLSQKSLPELKKSVEELFKVCPSCLPPVLLK